jgi:hypothetical protein
MSIIHSMIARNRAGETIGLTYAEEATELPA